MNSHTTSDWHIEMQRRRNALLDYLLLTAAITGLAAMLSLYIGMPPSMSTLERIVEIVPFLVGWLIIVITWRWRGLGYRPRALILLSIAYILGIIIFARGGLPGSGRVWLLLLPAMAPVLLGPRTGIIAGIISILTYAFFTYAISQGWVIPEVQEDLTALGPLISEGGAFLLVAAILTLILWSFSRSWIQALAGTSAANRELKARTLELEQANQQLHRRTSQLETTADIAHAGSSILDPQKLLTQVVDRVQEGFGPMGVVHAGLFLLEEDQRTLVLRAAAGKAGKQELKIGQKPQPETARIIERCVSQLQPQVRVFGDREAPPDSPEALQVPATGSEVALPLCSRGRTLGVLSVCGATESSFTDEDVSVLQTMADQVAVAIDNALLFSQTQIALEELQAVQRRYIAQAWGKFLDAEPMGKIDYTRPGAEIGDSELVREARRAALVHSRTVATTQAASEGESSSHAPQAALVVPMRLRGQVIGTLALHRTNQDQVWSAEEIALAETVTEQATLTVENLRLMDETWRRAARERQVSEITGRIWASLDPDTILKTTVRELGRALRAQAARIEVRGTRSDNGGSPKMEQAHGGED